MDSQATSLSRKQNKSEEPNGINKLTTAENGRVDIMKPLKNGGSFPPPLSCLKSFKTGMPYTYIRFNDEDDSFVLEEIKIPTRYFEARREDGRLKLFSINHDYEISEEEEKKEDGKEEEKAKE